MRFAKFNLATLGVFFIVNLELTASLSCFVGIGRNLQGSLWKPAAAGISSNLARNCALWVHLTSLPLNLCQTVNFDPNRMIFGEKRVLHALHDLCKFHSNPLRNEPIIVITRFLRKNSLIWVTFEWNVVETERQNVERNVAFEKI